MAVFSDITQIKAIEKQGQRIRSQFFAAVAHELRTPLNSIIPVLKMILERLTSGSFDPSYLPRLIQSLTIIRNSSIHLHNVVEDFLDINRLENNRFEIFKEMFSLRDAIKEVYEIMKF
jgi:signal transduction histidine kinase